jgi:hypothetical protein
MTTEQEYGTLRDRLVAVETKIDIVLVRLGDGHTDHEARIRALEARPDHARELAEHTADMAQISGRIRGLERFRWVMTGAAATGGGALGALVAQLLGVS